MFFTPATYLLGLPLLLFATGLATGATAATAAAAGGAAVAACALAAAAATAGLSLWIRPQQIMSLGCCCESLSRHSFIV